MKETKNKLLLIDGDMLLYKAACAAEQEMRWDDNTWTLQTNMVEAKAEADRNIDTISKALKSKKIKVFFSPSRTFRHDMWPAYKANRKDKRKPLGIGELRDWMMEEYDSVMYPNIEADDAIGIWATEDPENRVAVSGDKDFGTLPIHWYNHLKDTLRIITKEEADHFHLVQSLMGDTTDGFGGLKGCGPMTAKKLLEKNGATWQTIVDAYEAKGFTEDDALMTARLARILQHGDYDFDTNEVTLWKPTNA
jgi:DNA polymerase-1